MTPEDVLIERGLVSLDDLRRLLDESAVDGRDLTDSLVGSGILSAEQIGWHLADAHALPFVRVAPDTVDASMAAQLGELVLRSACAVPVIAERGAVTVATAAPPGEELRASVATSLGPDVHVAFAIATREQIVAALDRLFGPMRRTRSALPDESCPATSLHGRLVEAIELGADMLRFDPESKALVARTLAGGRALATHHLPLSSAGAIASRVRALCDGATSDELRVVVRGRALTLRLDCVETTHGTAVVCRIDPEGPSLSESDWPRAEHVVQAAESVLEGPITIVTAASDSVRRRLLEQLLLECGEGAAPVAALAGVCDEIDAPVLGLLETSHVERLAPRTLVCAEHEGAVADCLRALRVVSSVVLVRCEPTARTALALTDPALRPFVRGALCPRTFVEASPWI